MHSLFLVKKIGFDRGLDLIAILSNMLDLIADWICTSEDLIALKFLDLILDCSNLCVSQRARADIKP